MQPIERRLAEVEHRLSQVERTEAKTKREVGKVVGDPKSVTNPDKRNGVKRPSDGTKCRAAWDAMDTLVANGETPSAKLMRAIAQIMGWNENNTVAELYTWRRFNGLTGRSAA